jgi:hypothetical protein
MQCTQKSLFSTLTLIAFLYGFLSPVVFAANVDTVGYQGYVTNSSGVAQTGTQTVRIRIYDAATLGTLLYDETHSNITFSTGYFSVSIGAGVRNGGSFTTFASLPFDQQYYITLEITTLSTGEMSPRTPINSVFYAQRAYGLVAQGSDPGSNLNAGKVYFNTVSNTIKVYNGSAWVPLLTGAITSLNGQTGATQTFATTTNGTDFTISSGSDVHSFNLPVADGSHTGKLSSADWTTFNNKLSTSGLSSTGIVLNTASATLSTLAGTTTTVLHGNAAGLPTYSSIVNGDLSAGTFSNITGVGTLGSLVISGGTNPVLSLTSTATGATDSVSFTNSSMAANGANLANLTFKNNSSPSTGTVNGLTITEQAMTNATGNTANLINLAAATNGTVNGINITSATGFTNFFKTPSISIDSSGNIANVGAMSVASGGAGTLTLNTGSGTISSNATTLTASSLATLTTAATLSATSTTTLNLGASAGVQAASGTMLVGTTNSVGLTLGNTSGALTLNGSAATLNGGTGILALKGGTALGDVTTLSTAAGTTLNIIPSVPSSTGAGVGLLLKGSAATTTGNGGAVTITGGAAAGAGATGGTISITTGAGGASGTSPSGALTISTGTAASGTAGNITIDVGTSSTGNPSISLGTTTATSAGKTITIGATDQTGTIILGQSTGGQTISIDNSNAGAADTVNIGTGLTGGAGSKTINLATGASTVGVNTVNIGTGATTVAGGNTIHIGDGTPTGSGTDLITIGSLANASTLTLQGGTGATAITMQSGNGSTITIGSQTTSTTNTIVIGASGSTTNADNISIDNTSGANAGTITIGGTGGTGTIILGQSTGGQTISIDNSNSGAADTVNIGTGLTGGAGSKTINIGTGASTVGINTVNIGTGATTVAGGNTIHIGDGTPSGSGTDLITIGSLANASTLTLQGGTGATAITMQSGNGSTITIGSQTTSTTNAIVIGASGSTTNADNISINNTSGANAGTVTIGGTGSTGTIILGQSTGGQTISIDNSNAGAADTVNIGTGLTGGAGSKTINLATGASTVGVNTVNIGTGATTVAGGNTIHIGDGTPTGSGTDLITIGSLANASTLTLQGGTGATAITMQSGNGSTITIGSQTTSTTNTIVIGASGSTTNADNISIDNTSGANAGTITIGGTGGTGTIILGQSAAGGQTISIDNSNSSGNDVVNIGTGHTSGAGSKTINIVTGANSAGVQTVNIGTGATTLAGGNVIHIGDGTPSGSGTDLITIGSIAALANITTIQGGSSTGASAGVQLLVAANGEIGIGNNAVAKTITIGETGSTVQTVGIAGGTGANVVNIANAQTAGSVSIGNAMTGGTISIGGGSAVTTGNITIGSTGATTSVTIIRGGTGTGAFGGSTSGIDIIPGVAGTINIGASAGAGTGTITLGQSTATQTINIANGVTAAGNTKTVNIGTGQNNSTGVTAINIGQSNTSTGVNTVTIKAGGSGASAGPAMTLTPTLSTAVCSSLANATNPTAGTAYNIGDCTTGPTLDYAEMYAVTPDADYGDVMVMGTKVIQYLATDGYKILPDAPKKNTVQLVKATRAYQGNVIGIVALNYGDFTSTGLGALDPADHPMPIALNGQVPVKISASSSPIAIGDYVTTSNDSGKAMKATRAGEVIGKALEAWDPASGKSTITVFVEQGYFNGESLAEAFSALDATKPGFDALVLTQLVTSADSALHTDISDFFTDRITAGVEVITPKVLADSVVANTLTAQTINLGNDVSLQTLLGPDATEDGLTTLVSTIQSEIAHDPVALLSEKIAAKETFLADFVAARVTAIRGYFDEVFAKKVHTEQLCLKKSDGSEVCVTGDQIQNALNTGPETPPSPPPSPDVILKTDDAAGAGVSDTTPSPAPEESALTDQ